MPIVISEIWTSGLVGNALNKGDCEVSHIPRRSRDCNAKAEGDKNIN
jgi:hypothetical protein